ncbi:MAG TPA: type IV secretion system DNA-binding domain-containing protein, partial [Oligoflexia bacterium]|nr:type IV secretion system DNA-binding domain-containing protein [Oligoflexia bacterium]
MIHRKMRYGVKNVILLVLSSWVASLMLYFSLCVLLNTASIKTDGLSFHLLLPQNNLLSSAFVVLFFVFLLMFFFSKRISDPHFRGMRLVRYDDARQRAAKLREAEDQGLFWGGIWHPSTAATAHFCIVGATGSGKTISIRLLMQSVLSRINKCRGQRALVYDGKQDMLSILYGMGLDADIVLLNPFDVRSAAWDIAADITTPAAAQEIASILIPEDKNTTQPFFPDSGRHLLTKTIEFLIRRLPG